MSNQKRKSENNDNEEEVKRLKVENDQLKDQLKQTKEQLQKYVDEEEAKEKYKTKYNCCKHLDATLVTTLVPNDCNAENPSQYNAYSDSCGQGQFRSKDWKPTPVVYSQGCEHYLEWQCGCGNCWETGEDFFTLLCEDCEEEKLNPKPTCDSCGEKQSECGELREGMCGACITCEFCGKNQNEVGTLDDAFQCSTCKKKEQEEEEEERKREEEEEKEEQRRSEEEGKKKKQDDKHNENICDECGDKQSECGVLKDGKCGACIRDLDSEYGDAETVEEFMTRHPTGKPSQQQKRMNHLISKMQAEMTSLSEMQAMQAEKDKEEEEKKKVNQLFWKKEGPRQSTLSEFFS